MRQRCLQMACRGAVVVMLLALGATTRGGDEPRTQALELNKLTGVAPMEGMLQELKEKPEQAKKLVQAGLVLAKEKKLQYNAALILALAASNLEDLPAGEKFFRICTDQAAKLYSTEKLNESFGGLYGLLFKNKKYAEAARVARELLELKLADGKEREYYVATKTPFGDVDFVPKEFIEVFTEQVEGEALTRLIRAQMKQGKFDQALKLVETLLEKQNHWIHLELKGEVLHEADRLAEAAKVYEDVVAKIKQDKRVDAKVREFYAFVNRLTLSHVYVDLKQIDKATALLEALMAEKPNDPGLHNDLGYILADHDLRLEEAEKLIRKALELDAARRKGDPEAEKHENGAYLDSLAWVLFKQKRYQEAKEYLLKALEDKKAQHIEIYDHLGDVYMVLGEREAALAAWRKGLEVVREGRRETERRAVVEKKLAKYSK